MSTYGVNVADSSGKSTVNISDNLLMLLGSYSGIVDLVVSSNLLDNGTGFFFSVPYIPAGRTYAFVTFNYTNNTYHVKNTDTATDIYVGVY